MPGPSTEFLEEVASTYWPVALSSFGVALAATPICRAYARSRRIVDRPDDFLKPHKRPIPYLGGVAIFLAWATGIVVATWIEGLNVRPRIMAGVLIAGFLIMAVGLFDDLRIMKPRPKLLLNIAVGIVVFAFGVGRNVFSGFTDAAIVAKDPTLAWADQLFSVGLSLFIIVGACNATNLIDGLDGLCSGVLGIISVGFFVLATFFAAWGPHLEISHERMVLSLAMLGAALGFLPYNRNPATIFMGDAGSMLLGLNAAVLILMISDIGQLRWTLGAITVFGLPISDMLLTLLRRWRNARPLMIGDRSHFYDQLVDRGYTVRQVVAISYALTAFFVVVGCVTTIFVRTRYAVFIYAALATAVILAVWKLHMVDLVVGREAASPQKEATEVKARE